MTTNSESYSNFSELGFGTVRSIETLEEQRAINSNGVQMICIQKPSSKKETNSEEQPMASSIEENKDNLDKK